jgi:hypothetical protein
VSRVKYVIWPGHVVSENDRDVHYITYRRLIQLYGVNPADCIRGGGRLDQQLSEGVKGDLIHLGVQREGEQYEVIGRRLKGS